MSKKWPEDKFEWFDCDCGCLEHSARIGFFDLNDPDEHHENLVTFDFQYQVAPEGSLWSKVKDVLQYLFRGERYVWCGTILKHEDVERLKGVIHEYEQRRAEHAAERERSTNDS